MTWKDFPEVRRQAPNPGQTADAALTSTDVNPSHFSLHPVRATRPPQYQLADNIIVTIAFVRAKSWRADWVAKMSQADQDKLLKHEQGHYDLTALLARDFFLELMQLKTRTYAKLPGFQADLKQLKSRSLDNMQPVSDRYDTDTKNGAVPAQQTLWDGFINTAFTQQRTPPETAADGAALKMRILDVLSKGGIVI